MKGKTILAIGGHIGDMELTCGGVLATNALNGGKNITLALTAGEKGNPPSISVEDYRIQKLSEAKKFIEKMNGISIVFDYPDGELPNNEEVRRKVALVIAEYKPDLIITHWHSSMHKDHNATHYIVQDAQFYAAVCGTTLGKHYAPVYFAENWEDDSDFEPYIYVDISKGYNLWCDALKEHWFVLNSSDFKYYDYYTSLAKCKGAIARRGFAQCFNIHKFDKIVVKEEL